MKKNLVIPALLASCMVAIAAYGGTDYSALVIGTWKFDLGSGYMATIEYRPDGKFEQKVDELIVGGTYAVKGDKLTTLTKGQKTVFTLVSFVDNKLTVKRDKDGRTIVYIKQ